MMLCSSIPWARWLHQASCLVRITDSGKVLYRAEKTHCHRFPNAASEDLFGGALRNFQLFEPLDFLAELTQHIPNTRKHLIRYYGFYANKSRGIRAAAATTVQSAAQSLETTTPSADQARRRWAALIKRVYQTDPLRCSKCGGQMKIIAFIEAHQQQLIERILRHGGLWSESAARAPPRGLAPLANVRVTEPGLELDGEFLEHQRCEQLEFATPA